MDNSKIKILVVDDDELLQEILVLVLEDVGYVVDKASDGKEAWELMQGKRYDLLLTDLYMPEMNGIELILKSQQQFPDTKIVLLSGGGRELKADSEANSVIYDGQQIDVDIYLKKPSDTEQMLAAIKRLLST